jgi:MFS family permease
VVLLGSAAINVAEVFFVQDELDAGDVGFGVIVGASGVGLVIGSFLAAPALEKVGLRRHYVGSIALMGLGWGGAAFTNWIWVAVPLVIAGAIGNGAAVICNQLLVQRGVPDRFRGRAFATIMSSTFAVFGLGMAVAGVLVNEYGSRWVWAAGGLSYFVAAVIALAMTRWLPVTTDEEQRALAAASDAAAASIGAASKGGARPEIALAAEPASPNSATSGLERIADLLEQIERRRDLEGRRTTP